MYRKLIVELIVGLLIIITMLAPLPASARTPEPMQARTGVPKVITLSGSYARIPIYLEIWSHQRSDPWEWNIWAETMFFGLDALTRSAQPTGVALWWYYLTNPSSMDDDLETGFWLAIGTSVVAGTYATGIVVYPYVTGAAAGAAVCKPWPWPSAVIGNFASRVTPVGMRSLPPDWYPAIIVATQPRTVIVAQYYCQAHYSTGWAEILWQGYARINSNGMIMHILEHPLP